MGIADRRTAWLLLVGALLLSTALLVVRARALSTPPHDDVISYIAATGHQGAYRSSLPTRKWVPAADFQTFWEPDRFGVFPTIGADLAEHDTHPPLYFWLLHAWVHVAGVGLMTGPILNILLHLLTALFVFLGAGRLGCSGRASAAAAALFALSASVLQVPNQTRQYSLLALAAAVFVWCLLRFLERPTRRWVVGVAASAAAGLLTHYHFALLLCGAAGVAAAILLRQRAFRPLISLALAVAAAGLLLVLLHPGSLHAWGQVPVDERVAHEPDWHRLGLSLRACLELLVPAQLLARLGPGGLLALVAAGLAGLALLAWRRAGGLASVGALPALVTAGACLGIGALFVFGFSPAHAMGPRYIVVAAPTAFIAIGQLVDRVPGRAAVPVTALLLALHAASAAWSTRDVVRRLDAAADEAVVLDGPVIVDGAARGFLPRVLWHVDGELPVYVASQDALIAAPPELPPGWQRGFYVSLLDRNSSPEKRQRVVDRFRSLGYRVEPLAGSASGAGTVHALSR